MLRSTLLGKSSFLATLFANRPIDERPEAVLNPVSRKKMITFGIHYL
jgi:hypothetical protein